MELLIFLFMFFSVWGTAMVCAGILASRKNREVGGWVILAFFFSFLAVLILACCETLPKKGEDNA